MGDDDKTRAHFDDGRSSDPSSPFDPLSIAAKTPPPISNASDSPTLAHSSPVPFSPAAGAQEGVGYGSGFLHLPVGTVLAGRYKILRLLGEGGMGAVYQARDQELDRIIALKLIRPELASNPSILQRFKQELILARHVTHKNVVRIYDLGEAQGVRFITMEYVEGDDLRHLLKRDGKFPAHEAVEIVEQICRALDAAHVEGVIHRDLKPQNVMRDKQGRIVVMDFGLARSVESTGMTQTGALVGTLEYMSPEQALGSELDQRSDLFAVGLIFYELLTGKVPYKADTGIASLMKRTQSAAPSASDVDTTVPKTLSVIVGRCLERDPNRRFRSAQDLLHALESWQANPNMSASSLGKLTPPPPSRTVQISLNVPERRGWLIAGAIALVAVVLLAIPAIRGRLFHSGQQPATTAQAIPGLVQGKFVAVLPLKVIGDDKSLQYVSDGLVEALSTKMFQLHELHVASSSAIEKATAKDQGIVDVARALGVNLVLHGTVQGNADRFLVTLNLEDVAGGRRLWSKDFSGVSQDLLTMEDQIYADVVGALNLNPSADEMARSGIHPTENMTAYDLYLKGRNTLRSSQEMKDTESAVTALQDALKQDPNFALAYTGLADANLRLYKEKKDPLFAEKALAAAQQAATINSKLPEVHLALGSVYNATGKNAQAIEELKNALKLAPNSDEADARLGDAYLATGHKGEAISAFQAAVAANPYYWANHNKLGGAYLRTGDNDKALREYEKVVELASDNPIGYENIAAVYLRSGDYAKAIPSLEQAVARRPDAGNYSNLGFAYFFVKRYADAVKMFEHAVQLSPKDEQLRGNLADAYRWSGRPQDAATTYDAAIRLAYQALQVNPKSAGTTGDLAVYYAKKGNAEQAIQYIRQARSIDPADVQLMYSEAQVYAIAGQNQQALNALKAAFQKGYSPEEARNDPEMGKLKALPEFDKLLNQHMNKN